MSRCRIIYFTVVTAAGSVCRVVARRDGVVGVRFRGVASDGDEAGRLIAEGLARRGLVAGDGTRVVLGRSVAP